MPTPATAYLSFSLHRAGVLLGQRHPERLEAEFRRADRRALADGASGIHSTREEAEDYARRQGPMLVLTPAGEVLRFERGAPENLASREREYAEQRRRLPPERWQSEPRFRIY